MAGQAGSDQDQVTYRTYDDRPVSKALIDRSLRELDVRERRRRQWQRARTWLLTAVILVVLLAAAGALIWWRISTF